MHEMSIAESILELARRHTPAGQRLIGVAVRAGPLRAIDESALSLAWRAITLGTAFEDCRLRLQQLEWHLRCPACGEDRVDNDRFTACPCGCDAPDVIGGDELELTSIEVDPELTTSIA
jgi:hydrogenase nickel insertion protein HypA